MAPNFCQGIFVSQPVSKAYNIDFWLILCYSDKSEFEAICSLEIHSLLHNLEALKEARMLIPLLSTAGIVLVALYGALAASRGDEHAVRGSLIVGFVLVVALVSSMKPVG